MPEIPPEDTVSLEALKAALELLKAGKPNDRSEKDRRYAVAITELEKTLAYFYTFVILI